ncbi:LOW QUALITY PROTEIN: hypothetical protein BT93_B1683 [Corymbia citriodora subsp. variegata]|nr:LOW QUALITY PROTEIN: hypothetical protein BT93_B1683 [Corymbia citriodora subsp. variegata]
MKPLQTPPFYEKYLQEDVKSQECKDLLSSLPSEEDWLPTTLHLYRGFWFPSWLLNGVLACQNHFKLTSLTSSSPKCGTTWLKAILFSLLNRADPKPHDLVPFLELRLHLQNKNPDLTAFTSPRLLATHLPYSSLRQSIRDSKCKLVDLCRNPKDTFISMWHHVNKMMPEEKSQLPLSEGLEKFCRGVSFYGPYWDHVLGYHKVLGSNEEELRDGTAEGIVRMCSFDNLSALEVNKRGKSPIGIDKKLLFRKGEVGDWVNYMSAEMGERNDRVMEEKLHGSGLKF